MGYFEEIFDQETKAKATRLSFGETLAELGAGNENVVALDADLSKSTQTQIFAKEFPDRFYNMGIAEANMIGVAAGLARSGKIPFAASFGCFLTGRYDQIRMSVSFSNVPVRLVGTHAGVAIGEDGHSQMALEDLALMRSLPNMVVLQPCDDFETRELMKWSLTDPRPCYFRLTRQGLKPRKKSFQEKVNCGDWQFLNRASQAGQPMFVASGASLEATVQAADILKEKTGQEVSIVHAPWIQPVSSETWAKITETAPSWIASVEDHYINGGIGTLLAEYLAESASSTRLLRLGVKDFGQSGSPKDNVQAYRLDAQSIAEDFQAHL